MSALTPAQAQGKLRRALVDAGYQVKPWNRQGRDGAWYTRLYLRDAEGEEVGYVSILVGRIRIQVSLDDREPGAREHAAAMQRVVDEHIEQHGRPVAGRAAS